MFCCFNLSQSISSKMKLGMSISSILNLPTHTMYRSEKVHLSYLSLNDISLITVKVSQENIKKSHFFLKKKKQQQQHNFPSPEEISTWLTNKLTRLCHKKTL